MKTRQCGSCGGKQMALGIKDLTHSYKEEIITVQAVKAWHCPDCGESEFDSANEAERFTSEVATAIKEIDSRLAKELRAIRKRLGLKQTEAAAIFGGGVNAFSEYERGIRQPAKSTVLLLKLLDHHPELLAEIKAA